MHTEKAICAMTFVKMQGIGEYLTFSRGYLGDYLNQETNDLHLPAFAPQQ